MQLLISDFGFGLTSPHRASAVVVRSDGSGLGNEGNDIVRRGALSTNVSHVDCSIPMLGSTSCIDEEDDFLAGEGMQFEEVIELTRPQRAFGSLLYGKDIVLRNTGPHFVIGILARSITISQVEASPARASVDMNSFNGIVVVSLLEAFNVSGTGLLVSTSKIVRR